MFQSMRSATEPPDSAAGPNVPAPIVFCPTSACPLTFRGTSTRGVAAGDAAADRWNQYECRTGGRYEVRVSRRAPVTGAAWPAEIARAEGAGADEVLVKPFLPDALLAAAFRTWRRRRGVLHTPATRIQ